MSCHAQGSTERKERKEQTTADRKQQTQSKRHKAKEEGGGRPLSERRRRSSPLASCKFESIAGHSFAEQAATKLGVDLTERELQLERLLIGEKNRCISQYLKQ